LIYLVAAVINNGEAPAGIEKILQENDLGTYMLYLPRITIYKWKGNGFIRLAVKYYSENEDLPSGIIKEAVTKVYRE